MNMHMVPLKENVSFAHIQLKCVVCKSVKECTIVCKLKQLPTVYSKVATFEYRAERRVHVCM